MLELDAEQTASLGAVVRYCWSKELADYAEQRRQGDIEAGDPAHIFTDLVALDNLLNQRNDTPEDWVHQEGT